ncbi:MAG TPA: 2-oxo acid dehydrogenase subunit E2 [Marmoricola sp.]|nr:2-oxo acid dehydrogenase subunit E2 [Marmoricola sp.]
MAFKQRRDGEYVTTLPALRRVIPYLMPTRGESTVYFPMRIEADGLLAWLDRVNEGRPEPEHIGIFHVLLTAAARTLELRPEMNRFVAGRRTYQHREKSVSFVVKTEMDDAAPETEVRLVFTGDESVEQVRDLCNEAVARKRSRPSGRDDRLVAFFTSWPRPVLRMIARLIRTLDYHNVLPGFFRDAIPLYTSVYVVNTGSIGIDPPYHHLYEHGTASAFVSIGRITPRPVVDARGKVVARNCLDVVFTLDERATDGFYMARTAEVIRRLVADPDLLGKQGITVDELLAGWPNGE